MLWYHGGWLDIYIYIYLASNIIQVILLLDFMGVECNLSANDKVTIGSFFIGKCQFFLIYQVNYTICYSVYIENMQQMLKKCMFPKLVKTGKKSSFVAQYKNYFESKPSYTGLRKLTTI